MGGLSVRTAYSWSEGRRQEGFHVSKKDFSCAVLQRDTCDTMSVGKAASRPTRYVARGGVAGRPGLCCSRAQSACDYKCIAGGGITELQCSSRAGGIQVGR